MARKKLFGNRIEPNCEYCLYSSPEEDSRRFCKKLREEPKTQKCRHFVYDPLKRVPHCLPNLPKFDAEDFSL